MVPLMEYVNVLVGNEEDFELCLGYKMESTSKKEYNDEAYLKMFKDIKAKFSSIEIICSSLRESYSATFNGWSGILYDGSNFYHSKRYELNPICDRVGGGDSFCSGLIHGLLTNTNSYALEFAVAASALKHTIFGDFNLVTTDEVKNLMDGDSSGRVQR